MTTGSAVPTKATLPAKSAGDPFFYGWRYVPDWTPGGTGQMKQVPLTEQDVLHPEEDDFIVNNDAHARDILYLRFAFEEAIQGRPSAKVLTDHRIDWQLPDLKAHGPDVIVLDGLNRPWERRLRGTFPVKEYGATPVVVVEVTSPSTRHVDLIDKVVHYHKAGVPLYVIANRTEYDGQELLTVFGYRATPDGYVRTPADPKGVWVEWLGLWVAADDYNDVVCRFKDGRPILTPASYKARADAERTRADAEKSRADHAEAGRLAEKARADALADELRRLRGE